MEMRPQIIRTAPLPSGLVFWFGSRPLRVVSVKGDDDAAPVIVEEMTACGDALAGQFALWSLRCVREAMSRRSIR